MDDKKQGYEPEFKGPIWKHPYFLYIFFTVLLFVFLLVATWIAKESGLIPNRGI